MNAVRGGADYSATDMSFACLLANKGQDADMIFRALSKKRSRRREPISLKYHRILEQKGLDAADAYARLTAAKAIKFVTENPKITDRADAFVRIAEIEAVVDALPWGVYGGPRVRRALEAAFVVAERVGRIEIGLALREWSEICGQDFEVIRTNRDRLVRLEWLKRNPDDRPGRTSRYRLRVPSHIQLTPRYECGDFGGRTWLAHDAFRPEGLGDVGWYILTLAGSRRPRSELSIRAGIDPTGLEELLAVMVRADLVVMDDEMVERVSDPLPALNEVALRRGTFGKADADRVQHQEDRARSRARDVNVGAVRGART